MISIYWLALIIPVTFVLGFALSSLFDRRGYD